jgi:hypothetical protein
LDQLADASENGSQLVPLQQESLTFLAEVEVLSAQPVNPTAELTDLLGHRGETAVTSSSWPALGVTPTTSC